MAISPFSSGHGRQKLGLQGQTNGEARTLPMHTVEYNVAIMGVHYTLRDGQTKPCTTVASRHKWVKNTLTVIIKWINKNKNREAAKLCYAIN